MINEFLKFNSQKKIFSKKGKIIVAVSGGIDSMCMLDLFIKSEINIIVAHCNFQLRGKESDGDELFVKEFCEKRNIGFFSKKFNTKEYAKINKCNIQIAARELRYSWFEELRLEKNYDYIAVAHNSNDVIETLLINLFDRNTGIRGISGIKTKINKIIRPLLFAKREDIIKYINSEQIPFREDSSNIKVDYLRNRIRHKIIPILKNTFENFETNIISNISNFEEVEQVYNQKVSDVITDICSNDNNILKIDISNLLKIDFRKTILFEILKKYNFSPKAIDDVLSSLSSESGKQFYSDTHKILKDRSYLFVYENFKSENIKVLIKKSIKSIDYPVRLNFKISKTTFDIRNKNIANIDFDKLTFPLTVRKWERGDNFIPFGMKGKKKVSDYLIDNKISLIEKENTYVLLDASENIIWIIGHRIDDRFKITGSSKKVYIVTVDT